MKVLLVCENMAPSMGGEGTSPLYYAKIMIERGIDLSIVCHARGRDELRRLLDGDLDRVTFIEDTGLQKVIHELSKSLPCRVRDLLAHEIIHIITCIRMRPIVRRMVAEAGVDIIFEPTPIMPKGLSLMHRLGVPVVIGPLCGGMDLPPAFQDLEWWATRFAISAGRSLAELANHLVRGKIEAEALIVANPRTIRALPRGCRGRRYVVPDGGVNLAIWSPEDAPTRTPGRPVGFVFCGRFVDWKGIGFLVEAFADLSGRGDDCTLDLIGDGALRPEIERQVAERDLGSRVRLHGWLGRSQAAAIVRDSDVFVLPSLRECGSSAILEAMAMGRPVIATNWGGNADLVAPSAGILVNPTGRDAFVAGLSDAMRRLARSPELRDRLGAGGREHIRKSYFDWHSKVDRVIEILRETVERSRQVVEAGEPARRRSPRPQVNQQAFGSSP